MQDDNQPWWANDPELMEINRRTAEEFERALEQHEPLPSDTPDPVLGVPRQQLHRRFRR